MEPSETLDAIERATSAIRAYKEQIKENPELENSRQHRHIVDAIDKLLNNAFALLPSSGTTTGGATAICPHCQHPVTVTLS